MQAVTQRHDYLLVLTRSSSCAGLKLFCSPHVPAEFGAFEILHWQLEEYIFTLRFRSEDHGIC